MIRLTSHYFCAGLILDRHTQQAVTQAAPILAYMRGWSVSRVRDYAAKKRWQFEIWAI